MKPDKSDPDSCGCPEHRSGLSPLAIVLHEEGVGCNWDDRAPYRDQKHMEFTENSNLSRVVYDAGPFPHDGMFHWGDHQRVADAIGAAAEKAANDHDPACLVADCGCDRFRVEGSLDAAWAEAEAALPYKRWTLGLFGDWEDGWVASATSRLAGGASEIDVTTGGEGWGADRSGLDTPTAALRELTVRLRSAVNLAHQSPSEPPSDDPEGPDRA